MKIRKRQNICEWVGTAPDKPNPSSVVGLAIRSLGRNGILYGLRHPSNINSNGWYIWEGEFSLDEKFFSPVCVKHLDNYLDVNLVEYLDLPAGYRFLIDGNNYEDVWFDEALLKVK